MIRFIIFLLIFCLSMGAVAENRFHVNGLGVDRLFDFDVLTPAVSIAPDSSAIAIVVKRPVISDVNRFFQFNHDRARIKVVDVVDGSTHLLLKEEKGLRDAWYPRWSPNGEHLAFLVGNQDSDGKFYLAVWDRLADEIDVFHEDVIDIDNDTRIAMFDNHLFWLSSSQIFVPTLAPNEPGSEPRTNRPNLLDLMARYDGVLSGTGTSAQVFDGGVPSGPETVMWPGAALICDVGSSTCAPAFDSFFKPRALLNAAGAIPSPTGSHLALIELGKQIPPRKHQVPYGLNWVQHRIRLITSGGEDVSRGLEGVSSVVPGSIKWAPDGDRFAFVGVVLGDDGLLIDKQTNERKVVWIYDVVEEKLRRWHIPDFEMEQFLPVSYLYPLFSMFWAGDRLFVRGTRMLQGDGGSLGWWGLTAKGEPINLSEGLDFVPAQIQRSPDGKGFLALENGEVWKTNSELHWKALKTLPIQKMSDSFWASPHTHHRVESSSILLSSENSESEAIYSSVYPFDSLSRFPAPEPGSRFLSLFPDNSAALFRTDASDGTRLWVVRPSQPDALKAFSGNRFLKEIAEGVVESFEYESLTGERLTGWILLPVGYEDGQSYPMVTWVYQSQVYESRPFLSRLSSPSPLNLQLLSARGYAVLFPSMPGGLHDFDDLPNGVIPAVEKMLEVGIADPARLAVMGQSNGGYSVNGLIGMTELFKAAVSIAGMSELQSLALQFPAPMLVRDVWEFGPTMARFPQLESQMGFGLPWKSSAYRERSPISRVESIRTPLLLLHGDFDGVPVQQAEQLFVALSRLGKRVRLVRYPGDDHVFQSPENIKHAWYQIFAWLEEHLPPKDKALR